MSTAMFQLPLPPAFTPEEQQHIVSYVLELHNDIIRQFFRERGIPHSGTKQKYRTRFQDLLASGGLSHADLVSLIDSVQPWSDQHVFLFNGPSGSLADWRSVARFRRYLESHKLGWSLNQRVPLILPDTLRLSCVEHSPHRIRITAVERREAWAKNEALNKRGLTEEGEVVEYRAYVRQVKRGIIAFEWNLDTNTAFLQVTELPSHSRYEDAVARFKGLVSQWLELGAFVPLDLHPAIGRLHEREEQGKGETRSHGIDYVGVDGRRLLGRSASAESPLLGDERIDEMLRTMRKIGIGREGNFYFLSVPASPDNPIDSEAHAIIVAEKGRIHFSKVTSEAVIRHVLRRIQEACDHAS